MRKFLLRAAAWLTTFGFIAAIIAAFVAIVCSVAAAYFATAGDSASFFAWGIVAAGAYVAAAGFGVVATVLCVILKFSTEIEPIY